MAASSTQGGATAPPCITAAAAYIVRGWRVFPLNGKVPYPGTHGCKDATLDPNALLAWPRDGNVGIATGNGLVVLDIDGGGADTLHELEREHGPLPATPTVKTGGGQHYYLATEGLVANSAGRIGRGIDVRGDGGYVVAPPSIHPSGRRYEWDVHPDDVPLAAAPDWVVAHPPRPAGESGRRDWRRMMDKGLAEGRRNDTLTRLVGHLLNRDVDPYVALALVHAANRTYGIPPLPDDEVERIVESIAARELRKRR
jgi:hypothetical protein